jgi:hypothetical protein
MSFSDPSFCPSWFFSFPACLYSFWYLYLFVFSFPVNFPFNLSFPPLFHNQFFKASILFHSLQSLLYLFLILLLSDTVSFSILFVPFSFLSCFFYIPVFFYIKYSTFLIVSDSLFSFTFPAHFFSFLSQMFFLSCGSALLPAASLEAAVLQYCSLHITKTY